MPGHPPTLFDTPNSSTLQQCCLAYGGHSFPGAMKNALECHLSILKNTFPHAEQAANCHDDLVGACKKP